MENLFSVFQRNRRDTLIIILLSMMISISNIWIKRNIGNLIDHFDNDLLYNLIQPIIFLSIVLILATFLKSYLLNVLRSKSSQYYHHRLFDHLSIRNLVDEKKLIGNITTLISKDIEGVNKYIHRVLDKFLPDIFIFLLASMVLSSINFLLFLITLTLSILPVIILFIFNKKIELNFKDYQNRLEKVNDEVSEGLFNMELIKSYGIESQMVEKLRDKSSELHKTKKINERLKAILSSSMLFFSFFTIFIATVLSGFFLADKKITTGEFFLIISVIDHIISPIMSLDNSIIAIKNMKVHIGRINEFLRSPTEPYNGIWKDNNSNDILIEDLNFSYDEDLPLLRDVNIHFFQGRNNIIVGNNGSGKSTLFKLMSGVMMPTRGDIYIEGNNTKDSDLKQLRRKITILTQDTVLFPGTILENLKVHNEEISLEAVVDICKDIGIHDEIMEMSEKYNTILSSNGEPLSGGQKKRIAIARALIKKSNILLLDEPTGALDDQLSHKVMDYFRRMSKDKLIIMISHDQKVIDEEVDKIYELGVHHDG